MFGLSPVLLIGGVLLVAAAALAVFRAGVGYARTEHLAATITEQRLEEKIRGAIRSEGDRLSGELETEIRGIRLVNKTVVQRIQREKEVHHVLVDPNCSYPASTVRLLNDARVGKSAPRPAAGQPDPALPAAGAPANR